MRGGPEDRPRGNTGPSAGTNMATPAGGDLRADGHSGLPRMGGTWGDEGREQAGGTRAGGGGDSGLWPRHVRSSRRGGAEVCG